MAISHNIINNIVFSTELDVLDISGVIGTLPVSISNNGITVFNTVFTPDADGNVVIYDIRRIVEAYIDDVFSDFSFSIGDSISVEVRVFKSAARISMQAAEFLDSCFLTTVGRRKTTQSTRYETLSFYPREKCSVHATLSYYIDGAVTKYEVELLREDDVKTGEINTIDVSPKLFNDSSKGTLISMGVVAGDRSFILEIDNTLPVPAEPALLFRNNFGCWETIYLTGTQETVLDVKRSLAYINGRYRLYDIEDIETYKANSGILLGDMLYLGMDLARSRSIYLLDNDGIPTEEVSITESEIKYTNDDDSLPSFEYTYRRVALTSSLIKATHLPKLFDNTFDNTFN